MDRLAALVNIRNFVDKHADEGDYVIIAEGLHLKDLRDIVNPTAAEDVR
jgi:hypothetical protein